MVNAKALRTGDIILSTANGINSTGIRAITLAPVGSAEEATIVAVIQKFAEKHVGTKYNTEDIVLQAPFTFQRKFCELPVLPILVRDACISGGAILALGPVPNDQFFCSQFVLEAYKAAGIRLTDSDPRLVTPGHLLHMRQGDVPSIKIHQALQYVGH